MPKTLFRPQIDGSKFELIGSIDKKEFDEVRIKFESAVDDTINFLKPFYNGALEIYNIRKNLSVSVANEIPLNYILHCGIIFVMLDYYNARRFFPRMVPKREKNSTDIHTFFWRRTFTNIESNSTLLLSNMAIIYLIPDKWLPESWLVNPIKEQIRQLEIFMETTIDLTLKIPPGGNLWLRDQYRKEWEKLKKYLDSGQPWPIRLIGTSLNPYEYKSVIAYGYEDTDDGNVTIYVYDINYPGKEQSIKFRFHGKIQIIIEGLNDSHFENIRGFYCENYSPEHPPSSGISRFFRSILPMKSIWHIVRLTRLFWLWIK